MPENGAPSCRSASERCIGSFSQEQTFAMADASDRVGEGDALPDHRRQQRWILVGERRARLAGEDRAGCSSGGR